MNEVPSSKLIIHSVHGTWPYGLWRQMFGKTFRVKDKETPWFEDHSSFQIELATLTGRRFEWVPYRWNGKNSFEARHGAAKALAQHLTGWFDKEPEAEHVVIAHSHGGSVSIEAACILDDQNRNLLSKIITLATPFAEIRPSDRDIRELAARYMALRFGWAPLTLFACLVYVFEFRDPLADPALLWMVFPVYVTAMIAVVTPTFFVLWKIGLIKVRAAEIHKGFRPELQDWSLYAVRGPSDEANIAISTSQFVDLVSDLLFTRCMLIPFDWLRARLNRETWIGRLQLSLGLGLVLFIVTSLMDGSYNPQTVWLLIETDPVALARHVAAGIFSSVIEVPLLVALLIGAAYAALALVGPLVLIPANIVLALALGRDVLRHQGLMHIECEPIPSGITGIVSTVKVSEDERNQLGLIHFIHATRAARLRVAQILRECGPP
ncbi:hypothetical protein [Bradyrhizobium guangdongense]|uniref:Alpha/beta hydrolase n=2 Tax=Bradyrhizobium guangdongense TaxID=1325090 RepID=A0AA87W4G5_9BRAD|nr:hypothetical protein [Bradyrhizobium guangdongense]GGI21266.1 hypothetical protein GCM10010987_13460 [Bradyrhizobium guangdongense]